MFKPSIYFFYIFFLVVCKSIKICFVVQIRPRPRHGARRQRFCLDKKILSGLNKKQQRHGSGFFGLLPCRAGLKRGNGRQGSDSQGHGQKAEDRRFVDRIF